VSESLMLNSGLAPQACAAVLTMAYGKRLSVLTNDPLRSNLT
jgi:hypothetical protein